MSCVGAALEPNLLAPDKYAGFARRKHQGRDTHLRLLQAALGCCRATWRVAVRPHLRRHATLRLPSILSCTFPEPRRLREEGKRASTIVLSRPQLSR